MNGTTGSSQDLGDKLATRPVPSPAVPDRLARRLSWAAAAGIVTSIAIMIAASAVRNSWEHPYVVMPPDGMPWSFRLHVSLTLVSAAMWAAAVLGGGGVIAGLAAVARGARPSVRLLLAAGLVAVAVLTVLPAAGSTDTLDYAAYGRMVVLGHNPYVMTPDQLRHLGDPVGLATPLTWGKLRDRLRAAGHRRAVGGGQPGRHLGGADRVLAEAVERARVPRGGAGPGPVAALRPGPPARAHLLWTVNPLLLWGLVAEGHVDVMAAAAGLFGLAVLRKRGDGDPGALRGLAAGLLVGAAADLKITYVLFGVGLAWAARNWMATWFSAAAGAALVLFPSYAVVRAAGRPGPALPGRPGLDRQLLSDRRRIPRRSSSRTSCCWPGWPVAAVAVLVLWRLPDGVPDLPGDPSGAGAQRGLAVPLALPVPVVRRDGDLPARAVPGLAAGLADPDPADGRPRSRSMPGNAGFPAQPVLERDHQRPGCTAWRRPSCSPPRRPWSGCA